MDKLNNNTINRKNIIPNSEVITSSLIIINKENTFLLNEKIYKEIKNHEHFKEVKFKELKKEDIFIVMNIL